MRIHFCNSYLDITVENRVSNNTPWDISKKPGPKAQTHGLAYGAIRTWKLHKSGKGAGKRTVTIPKHSEENRKEHTGGLKSCTSSQAEFFTVTNKDQVSASQWPLKLQPDRLSP